MTYDREAEDAKRQALIEAKIAEHEADPDVAEVLAALDRWDANLAALVAQYPPEETKRVLRRVYIDADGNPRTRHRQLRAL
ncbi:hypothetical protein [Nocardioides pacificus]